MVVLVEGVFEERDGLERESERVSEDGEAHMVVLGLGFFWQLKAERDKRESEEISDGGNPVKCCTRAQAGV